MEKYKERPEPIRIKSDEPAKFNSFYWACVLTALVMSALFCFIGC